MCVRLVVPTSRRIGAGAGHDVGDAEAVADFDQFAARDDDLAAGGEFVQREEDGGGVVVDGDARRAQQPLEQRRRRARRACRGVPVARSYSRLE